MGEVEQHLISFQSVQRYRYCVEILLHHAVLWLSREIFFCHHCFFVVVVFVKYCVVFMCLLLGSTVPSGQKEHIFRLLFVKTKCTGESIETNTTHKHTPDCTVVV